VATVDDFRLIASLGLITGQWGNQMPLGDTNNIVMFDDFDGAALLGTWSVLKGTDAAAANFATNAGVSGTILGTTGATTTTMAGSGVQITGGLNFKAQGAAGTGGTNNLEFNSRVKVDVITNQVMFVGLTNAATLQMPIQGSGVGNAFTGNANDAVGFLFDTTMTTAAWWCVGNKAGAGPQGFLATAPGGSNNAPVAATFAQFAISVDQLGNANFFYNGVQVGVTMLGALTPTVALTPIVAVFNRTAAASRNPQIDYIMTSMNRI
jgi:hypothetical protein